MKNVANEGRTRSAVIPLLLAVLAIGLGFQGVLVAQETKPTLPTQAAPAVKLPPAKDIMNKSLDKMGGVKAIDAVKTMIQTGEFEMAAMGIKGTMKVLFHSDGRYAVSVDMGQMGQNREGYDGKVMWEMAPMQAPRILKGDEKEIKIRMQRMNPLKDFEKYYKKWETLAIENVKKTPCYKIKLTPKVGAPETHFIDTKTYLPIRTKMKMPSAMGEMVVVVDLKDYKKYGDILLPSTQDMQMGGMMQMSMKFTGVKINEELPKDAFNLPPEVKKLAEKQPAKKPGTDSRQSG